jgi:hypothetical protein
LIYLALLLVPFVPIAGLMAWKWHRRERHIRAAWRRLKASLDLATAKPRIDRCIELLLAEYGVDTFSQAQLVTLSPSNAADTGAVAYWARIAAERWQITLPPLELRVIAAKGSRFAGTFTPGMPTWSAVVGGEDEFKPIIRANESYEIQIAAAYLSDAEALPVILAHEISHLVLQRDGVTTGHLGEDEVLTDVAAALVGYGILMRRVRSRERRHFGPGAALSWSISEPGYLHPEELDYVLSRHEQLMREAAGGLVGPGDVAT